jgi:nitrite reductase/ring-hydroxylating ferredoxin subunit
MGKILVCKVSEIAPGTMREVKASDGRSITVANANGTFYAMGGECNHAGGPLHEGSLEGNIVTCPWHGAKWDIATGKNVEFAMDLDPEQTYKVAIEGDNVYIDA